VNSRPPETDANRGAPVSATACCWRQSGPRRAGGRCSGYHPGRRLPRFGAAL